MKFARRANRRRDADRIAEKVLDGLREDRRTALMAERRRGLWGLGLLTLAAATVAIGLFFLELRDRPAVYAVLSTSAPTDEDIVLRGRHSAVSDLVEAELKSLTIEAGGEAATPIELDIPVRSSDCEKLVAAAGGTCNGHRARPAPALSSLALSWSRSVLLDVAADDLEALRLSPPANIDQGQFLGTWGAMPEASNARLTVDCLVDSSLTVYRGGSARAPTVDCPSTGAVPWKLPVRFRGGLPRGMRLSGLYALHAHAEGRMARIEVEGGQLQLDSAVRPLDAPGGSSFTIGSASRHGVTLDVDGVGSFDRLGISVDGRPATSVSQDRHEQIATELSRNRDIWLALAVATALGLAGAWARWWLASR